MKAELLPWQNKIRRISLFENDVHVHYVVVVLRFWLTRVLAALPELILLPWCSSLWTSGHVSRSDAMLHVVQSIRLLTSPLLPCPHVPSRSTAAAKPHLHQPSKDGKGACNPHKCEHGYANFCANVQFSHAADSVAEDYEHDGCDDRGGSDEEGVEESKDGDGEGEPARVDGERH